MPLYQVIHHVNNLPKWFVGTKANYEALPEKDPRAIYFLYDTGEIMHKESSYNSAMIVYNDGERPLVGARDKLYVNRITLEAFIYDDDQWVQVFERLEDVDYIPLDDAVECNRLNGFGVNIITDHILDSISNNIVKDIGWNETIHSLVYHLGTGVGYPVTLNCFVSRLEFDPATRICTCYNDLGEVLCETTLMDSHIIGGSYDDARKAIIFKMKDGSEVRLKAEALINLFKGARTTTMTSIVKNYIDGKNVLIGEVNISIQGFNQLRANEDGIYAPRPIDLTDVEEGTTYKVEGDYIVPSVNISVFVTEEQLSAIKEEFIQRVIDQGSMWLRKSDIIQTLNETPRPDQVPSFQLVNRYCGLRRL